MPRHGNTITLADGRTHLFIAAGCSSLANVSLVVLCWTMFCQLKARRISEDYLWCLAASCAIVAINVGRISLIGFFPQHYELLHGALGASLASWLIVIAMMGIFAFGMNRGGWQHD
jgi:exosortase/archaeosortase family protein